MHEANFIAKNLEDQGFFENISKELSTWSLTARRILYSMQGTVHRYARKNKPCFLSQSTIARSYGVSRGYVNRLFKRAQEVGLLKVNYSIKGQTCYYYLPEFFSDIKKRIHYSRLFRTLQSEIIRPLLKRVPSQKKLQEHSITLFNIRKYITNNQISDIGSNLTIERVVMNSNPTSDLKNKLLAAIKEELDLTLRGVLKLEVIPFEILQFAWKKFKTMKNVKKPFGYLFKIATQKAEEEKVNLNWRPYYEYAQQAGDEPYTNAPEIRQGEKTNSSPSLSTTEKFNKPQKKSDLKTWFAQYRDPEWLEKEYHNLRRLRKTPNIGSEQKCFQLGLATPNSSCLDVAHKELVYDAGLCKFPHDYEEPPALEDRKTFL